jgi:hypothetical protein
MKTTSTLLTGLALASVLTVANVPARFINPSWDQASAEQTVQDKINLLTQHKGQIGSGDELRRYFYGDLEPIGFQEGGAGHVVNLYNKANDVTFAYCTTYDVIVAVKSGKVEKFDPAEVK